MSGFSQFWNNLAKSKKYREEFVAAQVKRGIPFQVRALLKQIPLSQEELASRAGLTQGVVSRAANPDYGNLTLNTIIRIAAGFDIAFVGKFVPFSELGRWFTDLSQGSLRVRTFDEEDREYKSQSKANSSTIAAAQMTLPLSNVAVLDFPFDWQARASALDSQSMVGQRPGQSNNDYPLPSRKPPVGTAAGELLRLGALA